MKEHVPEYCVHTSDTIKGFRGDYRFLSNFPSFENPIVFDGVEY